MKKDRSIPAYPCYDIIHHVDTKLLAGLGIRSEGMTLRDYFAGQALKGMNQYDYQECGDDWAGYVAHDAYEIADAMLLERERNDRRSEKEEGKLGNDDEALS
jgi:hypothetical protein